MNIDEFLEEYNKFRPEGKNWIMPSGDHEAKLMLVMSYPGYDATEEGNLLGGPNGEELKNALEIAGLEESDYYLTSMVKGPVGPTGKPTTEMIEQCKGVLDFEIANVKPKLIMTLGAEPFKQVKGDKSKMTNYLGNIIACQYDCKLLPNYSPGMIVNQDPTLRPLFREVFGTVCGSNVIEHLLDKTGIIACYFGIFDAVLLSKQSLWFSGADRDEIFRRVAAEVIGNLLL